MIRKCNRCRVDLNDFVHGKQLVETQQVEVD